jgi:hypothetical protein
MMFAGVAPKDALTLAGSFTGSKIAMKRPNTGEPVFWLWFLAAALAMAPNRAW